MIHDDDGSSLVWTIGACTMVFLSYILRIVGVA